MILRYVGNTYYGIIKHNNLYAILLKKYNSERLILYTEPLSSSKDELGSRIYYNISKLERIYNDWEDTEAIYKLVKEACKRDIRTRFKNWKIYMGLKKERD